MKSKQFEINTKYESWSIFASVDTTFYYNHNIYKLVIRREIVLECNNWYINE